MASCKTRSVESVNLNLVKTGGSKLEGNLGRGEACLVFLSFFFFVIAFPDSKAVAK